MKRKILGIVSILPIVLICRSTLADSSALLDNSVEPAVISAQEQASTELLARLDNAELVIAIRVEVALEQLNAALSTEGHLFSEGVKYGVNVTEVWKGEFPVPESLVYFEVPLSSCFHTLAKDTDYLLTIEQSHESEIHIRSCEDIVRKEEISDNITALYR